MKKPEEHALEYAGFWIRLGAMAIDAIILVIIFIIFSTIFHRFFSEGGYPALSKIVFGIILWLITVAYIISFWAWRGQTPGKMIMGIKIIRTDSSPLEWQYAILRYFGYIVSTSTAFIGFIWIAFDERKQGLHDKIADTYVVKLPVRQVVFSSDYARGRVG